MRAAHSPVQRAWHRVLLVLCVLSAGGLLLAFVLLSRAALSYGPNDQVRECYEEVLADAKLSVTLTIFADGADTPSMNSSFNITLPPQWPRARDLLSSPDTFEYRTAMRCLFRSSEDASTSRSWEWRSTTPTVTLEDTKVGVTETIDTWISDVGDKVGPWQTTFGPQTWAFRLVAPDALRQGTFTEVEVNLPDGWRHSVSSSSVWKQASGSPPNRPWYDTAFRPNMVNATTLTWKDLPAEGARSSFAVRPDWQASMVRVFGQPPGSTVSTLVQLMSHALVLVWGLYAVRRAGSLKQWREDYPRRAARLGEDKFAGQKLAEKRAAYLKAATQRATRIICIQLAILAFLTADAIVYDWVISADYLTYKPIYEALDGAASAWAVAALAWACGVRVHTVLVLAFAVAICAVGSFQPIVGENQQAKYGIAFVATLALGMAVLTLFEGVWRPFADRRRISPLWVWLGGMVFAAATLALYGNFHAQNIPLREWLAFDVDPFLQVQGIITWYPWLLAGLIVDLVGLVIIVVLIAQLHARTAVDGPRPTRCDLTLIAWVFAVATVHRQDFVMGLWLPITLVLSACALWIALAVTRRWSPLNHPALRALRNRTPGTGFRAHRQLVEHARGSREEVRAGVQERPDEAGKVNAADGLLVRLAFAYGPDGDPWRTALFATFVSGAFGLIPASWFLWTAFQGAYWLPGGREFAGIEIPTSLLNEGLFWLVPGFLLGLLWRYLPGRSGVIKVLPIAASYVLSALAHQLMSRLLGQDPMTWALQRSLLVWGVLSITAIIIDVRALRLLERGPGSVRYNLATLYGIGGWPARLTGLLPQITAIALMIYVIVQGETGLVQSDPLQTFKRG
ncbi:DUF6185 family protein [Nonomuraea sp. NPDC055795]